MENQILTWALNQGLATVAATVFGWFILQKVDNKLDRLDNRLAQLIDILQAQMVETQKQRESIVALLGRIEQDHARCENAHREILAGIKK